MPLTRGADGDAAPHPCTDADVHGTHDVDSADGVANAHTDTESDIYAYTVSEPDLSALRLEHRGLRTVVSHERAELLLPERQCWLRRMLSHPGKSLLSQSDVHSARPGGLSIQ